MLNCINVKCITKHFFNVYQNTEPANFNLFTSDSLTSNSVGNIISLIATFTIHRRFVNS